MVGADSELAEYAPTAYWCVDNPGQHDNLIRFTQERSGDARWLFESLERLRAFSDLLVWPPDIAQEFIGHFSPDHHSAAHQQLLDYIDSHNLDLDQLWPVPVEMQPHQQALRQEILRLGKDTAAGLIAHWQDPQALKYAELSFGSLQNILAEIFSLRLPVILPPEQTYRPGLTEFLLSHFNDHQALALALSLVTNRWVREMRCQNPSVWQTASRIFYTQAGSRLNTEIVQVTADTKQELTRLAEISRFLQIQGMLDFTGKIKMADFGTNDSQRILAPYRDFLGQYYRFPAVIIAVDLLPQEAMAGRPWRFQQGDLADPWFNLGRVMGKLDLVISTWSVPCDLAPADRPVFWHNISRSLRPGGVAIVDEPSSGAYLQEINEYHSQHPNEPLGVIEREFDLADGRPITKKFYIPTYGDEVVSELALAGLRMIENIPGIPLVWQTTLGHQRVTRVVVKDADPRPLVHQLWVGSSA